MFALCPVGYLWGAFSGVSRCGEDVGVVTPVSDNAAQSHPKRRWRPSEPASERGHGTCEGENLPEVPRPTDAS